MPKTDFIEKLRRRLVELGCPMPHVRRFVREVADHHEDLKQAALREGLSGADAESRANERLGDPLALAEDQMMMLRKSSWLGRHSLIGFCVLPILAVPVLWALLLFLDLSLEFALGYGWDSKKLHAAADNPVAFHHLALAVHCADLAAVALVTLFFCWLARRSAVNIRWMLVACAICSLYALFFSLHVKPHFLILGINRTPEFIRAAVPFLIAGAIYASQRRRIRGLHEEVAV